MPENENELFKAVSDAVVWRHESGALQLATEAVERRTDACTSDL